MIRHAMVARGAVVSTEEVMDLQMVRLQIDTAIGLLDKSIESMAENIWPTVTLPLARMEVTKARNALSAMLPEAAQ